MTPEELRLRELEMAQAEAQQQQVAAMQQQATQSSQAQMEATARQIQEDVAKRESELAKIGYPSEPYLPHSYSAPGVMIGDQISAVGQTAQNIGQSTVQGVQNLAGGIVGGLGHMMSDIGAAVRPIFRTPPMPTAVGYGGYYAQTQGFLSSIGGAFGLGSSPSDAMASDYRSALASDAGERLGYGTASALATGGGIAASFYAAKLPGVGAAGAAIGRGLGGLVGLGGVGAKLGRFGLSWLALPMAAYELGSAVSDQALGSRRRNQGFLESSSFRFAGIGSEMADPRMGRGVSRENRREIAEFLRTMDIEDELLGGEDITKILEEGTRFGLFEGFGGEIEKFKKKFTEIKDNVREMAKVLNVSLEEGLATMKEMYGAGIDPSRAREVATFASAAGRVAGRTGSEMITLGLQGAEQFRGTGVSMDIGMRGAMMNLTSIRAARDAGLISKEAIEQAGGEEALALRRTQRQVQFAQSGEGRAYMASFFDQSTGGLNATAFEEAITGGKDIAELARDAARNLNDPAKLIQFESQQERVASEMGKAFGGRGLQFGQWGLAMAEATYMSRYTGATTEDAFRSIMLRKGVSSQELEAIQGEIGGASDIFKASQKGAAFERDRLSAEEKERNSLLNQVVEKLSDISKQLLDIASKPLNKLIDKMTEGVEELSDSSKGLVRGDVSNIPGGTEAPVTEEMTKSGPQEAQERKTTLYSERSGAMARDARVQETFESTKVLDADVGGAYFGLGNTAGENLQEAIEEGAFGTDAKKLIKSTTNRGDLAIITGKEQVVVDERGNPIVGPRSSYSNTKTITRYTGLTKEDLRALEKRGGVLGIADADLEKMAEAGRLDSAFKNEMGESISIKAAVGMATATGKLDINKGLDENVNALLADMGVGKWERDPRTNARKYTPLTIDDLSFEQLAAVTYQMRKDPRWKEKFEESRGALTKLQAGVETGETLTYQKLGETQEDLMDKLESAYGVAIPAKAAGQFGKILALKEDLAAYTGIAEEGVAAEAAAAVAPDSLTGNELYNLVRGKIKSGEAQMVMGKDLTARLEKKLGDLSLGEIYRLTNEDISSMIREGGGTAKMAAAIAPDSLTGKDLVTVVSDRIKSGEAQKVLGRSLADRLESRLGDLSQEEITKLTNKDISRMIREEAGREEESLRNRMQEMAGELAMDVLPSFEGSRSDTKKFRNLLMDVLAEDKAPLTAEETAGITKRLKQIDEQVDDLGWTGTEGAKRRELEKERLLLRVKQRGAEGAGVIADLSLLSTTLVSRQNEMAKNLYGGLLGREMIESGVDQETVDLTRSLIGAMVDSPVAMAQRLSDEDKALLQKTKTGQFFLSQGEGIRKLQETVTNLKAEGEDVTEETFTKIFGDTRGKKMFERYEDTEDIADVLGASFNEVVASTVGTQKTAGGGYVTDTAMQSSTELFRVLTAENLTTLKIMESLYQTMKGSK